MRATSLPWLTSDIRTMMRRRDFHHKRAQKTKAEHDWITYRDLRNRTTRLIRDAKRDYYSNIINKNKKDSAKLWKIVKSVISKSKKTSSIGSLETVSGLTCEPRKIAQGFANYFRTGIMKIRQNLLLHPTTTARSLETRSVFRLSRVEEEYVCKELKKIQNIQVYRS